jgi:hypothetical protein
MVCFDALSPWMYSVSFGLMWLCIALNNAWCLIEARRRQGQTFLTLFIGGILGVIAVLAAPIDSSLKVWAWIPAILDPGCLPALGFIVRNIRK